MPSASSRSRIKASTYTTREKAVDLGPIQITAEKTHTLPLPPIVGGVALVGGLLLLVAAGKKA